MCRYRRKTTKLCETALAAVATFSLLSMLTMIDMSEVGGCLVLRLSVAAVVIVAAAVTMEAGYSSRRCRQQQWQRRNWSCASEALEEYVSQTNVQSHGRPS